MLRPTLCLIVFALGFAPAVAADVVDETLTLGIDADELEFRMQVTLTGAEAQSMREEIDEEELAPSPSGGEPAGAKVWMFALPAGLAVVAALLLYLLGVFG